MTYEGMSLFLSALAMPGTCFVLGAGASAPDLPVTGEIATRLGEFTPLLGSFGVVPLPNSRVRQLGLTGSRAPMESLEYAWEWHRTAASTAVLLRHVLRSTAQEGLSQYRVFRLFDQYSSVVSFNWDGLARDWCPQRRVIHPHGAMSGGGFTLPELDDLLFWTQEDDWSDGRDLLGSVVLPGEEEAKVSQRTVDAVRELWMSAPAIVVIGYGFGSGGEYDEMWAETFGEAMRRNATAPVHFVAPKPLEVAREMTDRMERSANVHAWPLHWNYFSRVLLSASREHGRDCLAYLMANPKLAFRMYGQVVRD